MSTTGQEMAEALGVTAAELFVERKEREALDAEAKALANQLADARTSASGFSQQAQQLKELADRWEKRATDAAARIEVLEREAGSHKRQASSDHEMLEHEKSKVANLEKRLYQLYSIAIVALDVMMVVGDVVMDTRFAKGRGHLAVLIRKLIYDQSRWRTIALEIRNLAVAGVDARIEEAQHLRDRWTRALPKKGWTH